jgi:SRSO17 transposase
VGATSLKELLIAFKKEWESGKFPDYKTDCIVKLNKRPTIRDVAAEAGVSKSLVLSVYSSQKVLGET